MKFCFSEFEFQIVTAKLKNLPLNQQLSLRYKPNLLWVTLCRVNNLN